jgi:hypothetical protein
MHEVQSHAPQEYQVPTIRTTRFGEPTTAISTTRNTSRLPKSLARVAGAAAVATTLYAPEWINPASTNAAPLEQRVRNCRVTVIYNNTFKSAHINALYPIAPGKEELAATTQLPKEKSATIEKPCKNINGSPGLDLVFVNSVCPQYREYRVFLEGLSPYTIPVHPSPKCPEPGTTASNQLSPQNDPVPAFLDGMINESDKLAYDVISRGEGLIRIGLYALGAVGIVGIVVGIIRLGRELLRR